MGKSKGKAKAAAAKANDIYAVQPPPKSVSRRNALAELSRAQRVGGAAVLFCAIAGGIFVSPLGFNEDAGAALGHRPLNDSWSTQYDPALEIRADRCSIDRVKEEELTFDVFKEKYMDKQPLVVLRAEATNKAAREATTRERLLSDFGNKKIKLTVQQGYAFRRQTFDTFRNYLQKDLARPTTANDSALDRRFAFQNDQFGVGKLYKPVQVVIDQKNADHGRYRTCAG